MKFKIQEHKNIEIEYIVYGLAPNGEVCKRVASCRDKRDAEHIVELLNKKDEGYKK